MSCWNLFWTDIRSVHRLGGAEWSVMMCYLCWSHRKEGEGISCRIDIEQLPKASQCIQVYVPYSLFVSLRWHLPSYTYQFTNALSMNYNRYMLELLSCLSTTHSGTSPHTIMLQFLSYKASAGIQSLLLQSILFVVCLNTFTRKETDWGEKYLHIPQKEKSFSYNPEKPVERAGNGFEWLDRVS